MTRLVLVVFGVAALSAGASAQPGVVIADRGPGAPGRILTDALAGEHRLVEPDTSWLVLGRDTREAASLIVLGRTAAIAGMVLGDVVVVGGDLHLRPGARITGEAVAIGGGVYTSTLAFPLRGTRSFRDQTYDITRTPEGYQLAYRSLRAHASSALQFPGFRGLRFPSYDRVNGASVRFGPDLIFAGARGELTALATYRSDLGQIDPSIATRFQFTPRFRGSLYAGRGTFSNDDWIWMNFVNSLSVLVFGSDTRNYYRATRVEIAVHRLIETATGQLEPFAGLREERASPVGPQPGARGGPWSIWGRAESLGILRPNPAFEPNAMFSALIGSTIAWESSGLRMRGRSVAESSLEAWRRQGGIREPLRFTQVTSDIGTDFLTFREQEYRIDVHWVTTLGDVPPPQRFAYFGGSGTMPFLDLLEQGGDELLFVDQRYSVPLRNLRVGTFGNPTVFLRHRLGGAGIGELPDLEQALSLGTQLALLRGEVLLNPADGDVRFSIGLTLSR